MKNQTDFHNILESHNEQISTSFLVTNKTSIEERFPEIIEEFIGHSIYTIKKLVTRSLVVVIKDSYDVSVSIQQPKKDTLLKVQQAEFESFIAQSTKGLFLIVKSTFNIYDFLNREPYHETMGEYRFQKQLGNALGLKNATAYLSDKKEITEEIVVEFDLSLMYSFDKQFSYLIYKL